MVNLFTYGSLMYGPVWARVVGGRYRKLKATLTGYRRFAVRGESYPALWPGESADEVQGALYLGVECRDLARLDAFEGVEYRRVSVRCQTSLGEMDCVVYRFKAAYGHRVLAEDWDPERFEREGLGRFLAREGLR